MLPADFICKGETSFNPSMAERPRQKPRTSFKNLRTIYRMSQELRSLFRDLIPELILSQKRQIHMAPIRDGSEDMSF